MYQQELVVATRGQGLYDFTRDVQRFVADSGRAQGLLTLFVRHTSCSLLIQENADPEVQTDLLAYFARLVPPSSHPDMGYLRHTYEGPDDMPAHIKAAMMPVSLSIPVSEGRWCWAPGRASTCSSTAMRRTAAESLPIWRESGAPGLCTRPRCCG